MFLSTKGRYAVMAMVELGMQTQGPVRLATISQRQGIDLSYLEQIFAKLKEAGLVQSIRGPGGGYLLQRPSEKIAIGHIIEAVEESIKMTRCPNNNKIGCMKDGALCATHNLWEALEHTINDFIYRINLADVCQRNIKIQTVKGISGDTLVDVSLSDTSILSMVRAHG